MRQGHWGTYLFSSIFDKVCLQRPLNGRCDLDGGTLCLARQVQELFSVWLRRKGSVEYRVFSVESGELFADGKQQIASQDNGDCQENRLSRPAMAARRQRHR